MFGVDADALDKMQELLSVDIVEIGGYNYHVNSEEASLVRPPTQAAVQCFSLTQLLSAVKADGPSPENNPILINVRSPFRVEAICGEMDECWQRDEVAVSDFSSIIRRLDSGTQYSQEEFIIKLQSLFMPNQDLNDLLRVVGSVKAERVMESEDDGVSQKVAAKAGVHLVTEMKVKNPWSLQPFMTFPEIEPVDVIYLLRLHQRSEELPKFALYECDGGRWQIKTVDRIKEFLQKGVTDLGLTGVTVL